MWNNVGSLDRVIRIALGLVLLSLVRFGPQTEWGYLGFLPLLTGAFGYCPIDALLRISADERAPAGATPRSVAVAAPVGRRARRSHAAGWPRCERWSPHYSSLTRSLTCPDSHGRAGS